MVDWKSPVTMAHAFYAATALMWLSIGLFAYETVRFLSFDVSVLLGKRQRRWPQVPFFFSKLCMWSYLITNMVFILTKSEINCNGVLQGIEMQMGWIAVSSSMLLAFRAVCVYTGKTRTAVSVVLTLLIFGVLAAWMEGVRDTKAVWVPNAGEPWRDGTCAFTHIDSRYAAKYVVTIVFDFIVMALTIIGVVHQHSGSRIGDILIKQGVQYFALTFLTNALVAGLTLSNLNPVMSLIGAIPSATVCVMCSTRLYVKLIEEAAHKPEGVDSATLLTSTGTSERLSKFFKRSTNSQKNTFSSRSNASATTGAYQVSALTYTQNEPQSPEEGKTFALGSQDDLEAQALRSKKGNVVNITEDQTIVTETMPPHLSPTLMQSQQLGEGGASTIADQPYASAGNSVQSEYPRLSKT